MDATYLVGEETSDPKTITNTDSNDSKANNKCCTCKSNFLFVAFCLLTIAIIGGFGFLFGPLILQTKFPLFRFSPSQITVKHYRLRLEPNYSFNPSNTSIEKASQSYFHGRASIIFHNARKTNELRLISQDLRIEKINLTVRNQVNLAHDEPLTHLPSLKQINETGRSYHVGKVTNIAIDKFSEVLFDNHKELLLLLKMPLEVGDYMVDIHYRGKFHPFGLDKATYQKIEENAKKTKYLILMKGVSRVLPYFNNNQRIKFELSIARKTDMVCFTNVAFREIEPIKDHNHTGYIWEHFKITPEILPTTLGIVIADYKSVNVSTSSPVVLKLFAPRRYHKRLSYASEVFATIFEHFEDYFQVHYPLPKLDLLLVDDEVMPLTSKLGLITLNSERLLLAIIDDNVDNRRKIFSAISEAVTLQFLQILLNVDDNHELVYGFAKFLAYNAESLLNQGGNYVNQLKFRWNSEEYFMENVLDKSLDSFGSEKELKMACVFRMINYTLNGNVFQMGLSKFLLNSKDDFWEAAENLDLRGNATGKQLLLSWWENPAYPVITITRTTGWNIIIDQSSILTNNSDTDLFTIPLSYISKKQRDISKNQDLTLNTKQILTNLFVPQEDWILFNYNRIGYYRVNYQLEDWHKLIKQLEEQSSEIPVINRAALINDAFALADEDLLQLEVPFQLINYLRQANESNYLPWRAGVEALNRHEAVFLDSSDYGIFRRYKINLLKHLWSIRYDNLNPKLTTMIETELCKMQFKPCVKSAREFYDKHKNRRDVVIPQWVFCTVLAHSQEEEFDFLYNRMKQSNNHNEIRALLRSLTCTTISWKINSLLEESLSNIHYAKHIWSAMSTSSMSRLNGLVFLETQDGGFKNATDSNIEGNDFEIWKIIIDEFISTMSTTTNLNKINNMSTNLPQSLQGKLSKARTRVTTQIEWTKKHLSTFIAELSKTL